MRMKVFLSKSAVQTKKFAGEFVRDLLASKSGKRAVVLALEGELGSGKTTFVQGLAKALGVKEKILSPTFVIIKHFNILTFKHFSNLYHIDCYRLDKPKELTDLGFKKIINDPKNLVVIEWAEKIKPLVPKNAVWLGFEWSGEEERKIIINLIL